MSFHSSSVEAYRPTQHIIGHFGDDFYRSYDQTNSVKALKETSWSFHRRIHVLKCEGTYELAKAAREVGSGDVVSPPNGGGVGRHCLCQEFLFIFF